MSENANPEPAEANFEAYLTPLLDAAFGAALHMTRNRDDAEDLVQEAALQAFRAFRTFQPGTHFKAWFFRILTNLFINTYRKRRREPDVGALSDLDDGPRLYLYGQTRNLGLHTGNSDPAEIVIDKLETIQVTAAIAALPEEYRIVAALYFVHEFSYQEIAAVVACPVGTVRSRLHRGRRMLQKALWRIAEDQGVTAGLRPNEELYGADR
jgi:RNA polymerase sigma-70 factor (ECF subfamily)